MGRQSDSSYAVLDTLLSQMMAMKQTVLEEYATSCGVQSPELETAIDADEPKAEIIRLILRQRPRTGLCSAQVSPKDSARTPPDQQSPAQAFTQQPDAPEEPDSQEQVKSEVKADSQAASARRIPVLCPSSLEPTSREDDGRSGLCPFCEYTWGTGDDTDENRQCSTHARTVNQDVKTRKRRMVGPRRQNRKGRWWRRVGYDGPAYCQRCSEVFRDHLIRQKSNSVRTHALNKCHFRPD